MGEAGVELDSHVTCSLLPQNPDQVRPRSEVSQKLLFMLVSLILGGIATEAYLTYQFYHHLHAVSASTSANTSGQNTHSFVLTSKSFAHLTDGSDVVHENQIMHWSINNLTLPPDMDYRHGRLIVRKEGTYHVYSKVSFINSRVFQHCVMRTSPYYAADITLMRSLKYSLSSSAWGLSNSYLGGVFHLCRGCAIFVKVSNTSNVLHDGTNNFFGAFMI
ncbi:tumor necrosis factor ligand superfamily member 6-like [Toxotes jaculatrix]|uniref:tumor necrosis factor ligand superfamily member 6-like n=1 Tax=Toxotes jaculatrix TaxID=941984 RepID=UPI001B3AC0FF|nr:tumor necrosis factor ligand superfamily member 6-like [Toxotes jaculatrix]